MPYVARPSSYLAEIRYSHGAELDSAVYLYACHLHRSSDYLDLSFRETSSPPKETMRKRLSRHWNDLYDGNFYSSDLDSDRRVIDLYEKPCYEIIFCYFALYQSEFRIVLVSHILDSIENSQDLIGTVRNYLSILRMIIASSKGSNIDLMLYAINRVMQVLVEQCEDSHLVADVVTSLSSTYEFTIFLVEIGTPELMEYVMYHCQKARCDFWSILSNGQNVSTKGYTYIFRSRYERQEVLRILFKYGVTLETTTCLLFCGQRYAWFHERLQRKDIETDKEPDRRETLRHILSCFVLAYREGGGPQLDQVQKCIRMIWESLPDAYHSPTELEEYTSRQQAQVLEEDSIWTPEDHPWDKFFTEMCNWYINNIAGDTLGKPQPRSLQRLCRVVIRKKLAQSFQLPNGIASLGVPTLVQEYLGLE